MNETTLIVIVLVVSIGFVGAIAYLLDRRRKTSVAVVPELPPESAKSQVLRKVTWALLALVILSMIGFFVFQKMTFAWLGLAFLIAFLAVRWAYQIVRLGGN